MDYRAWLETMMTHRHVAAPIFDENQQPAEPVGDRGNRKVIESPNEGFVLKLPTKNDYMASLIPGCHLLHEAAIMTSDTVPDDIVLKWTQVYLLLMKTKRITFGGEMPRATNIDTIFRASINNGNPPSQRWSDTLILLNRLAKAHKQLHDRNIAQLDIGIDNVVILGADQTSIFNNRDSIRLIDFDAGRTLVSGKTRLYAWKFENPSLDRFKTPNDVMKNAEKNEVFVLGAMAYYFWFNRYCYYNNQLNRGSMDGDDKIAETELKKYNGPDPPSNNNDFDVRAGLTSLYGGIIKPMLSANPDNRPTMKEIIEWTDSMIEQLELAGKFNTARLPT